MLHTMSSVQQSVGHPHPGAGQSEVVILVQPKKQSGPSLSRGRFKLSSAGSSREGWPEHTCTSFSVPQPFWTRHILCKRHGLAVGMIAIGEYLR